VGRDALVRRVKKIILVAMLLLLAIYLVGLFPLEYNVSYEGIRYRINDPDYSEKVIVQFDGYRFNKLYKCDEFNGTLTVDGVEYSGMKLRPGRYNEDLVFVLPQDTGYYTALGMIFTDNDLNKFSIQRFEDGNDGGKGWSSKDGLVYSMPATTREEAVEIAEGMQAIAYDADHFMNEDSRILEGDYIISIDLSDLSSNIGKELYNDGKHFIKLESIEESGNYMIRLRSSGEYGYDGATLISIIQHDTSNEGVYKMNVIPQITAEYMYEINYCKMISTSSINFDNGDEFIFYIFPSDEYPRC
jgi:hypothetical protein